MRPRAWILTLGLLAAAVAVLPLWAAPAAEPATPATPTVTADNAADAPARPKVVKVVKIGESAAAPAMHQLVAVRDAETGAMRAPTAAEWKKLAVNLDPLYRSDIGLEETHYEDGSVSVVLGDRFQSLTFVQRSADGKLVPSCTHEAQKAADVINGITVHPATGEARNDQ